MNIRVDTVLPPPPEPTKMVVITLSMEELYVLYRYMKYGRDGDHFSAKDKVFLDALREGTAAAYV